MSVTNRNYRRQYCVFTCCKISHHLSIYRYKLKYLKKSLPMQHHSFFLIHPVHFFHHKPLLHPSCPVSLSLIYPFHPHTFPYSTTYFILPSQSLPSPSTFTTYALSSDPTIPSTTILTKTHSPAHPFCFVLALSLRSFILTTSQAPSLLPSLYVVTQDFSWGRFRH